MNQESGIRNQESGIRNQESGIRNQESLASLTSTSLTSPTRSAFTMIELVFIIVILGILGAIAVPKMAASRQDALIAATKNDFETIKQSMLAHAMAQGDMTQGEVIANSVTLSPELWYPSKNWYGASAEGTLQSTSISASRLHWDGSVSTGGGWPCISFGVWVSGGEYAPCKLTGTTTIAGEPYLWYKIEESEICQKIAPKGEYCLPLKSASVVF